MNLAYFISHVPGLHLVGWSMRALTTGRVRLMILTLLSGYSLSRVINAIHGGDGKSVMIWGLAALILWAVGLRIIRRGWNPAAFEFASKRDDAFFAGLVAWFASNWIPARRVFRLPHAHRAARQFRLAMLVICLGAIFCAPTVLAWRMTKNPDWEVSLWSRLAGNFNNVPRTGGEQVSAGVALPPRYVLWAVVGMYGATFSAIAAILASISSRFLFDLWLMWPISLATRSRGRVSAMRYLRYCVQFAEVMGVAQSHLASAKNLLSIKLAKQTSGPDSTRESHSNWLVYRTASLCQRIHLNSAWQVHLINLYACYMLSFALGLATLLTGLDAVRQVVGATVAIYGVAFMMIVFVSVGECFREEDA